MKSLIIAGLVLTLCLNTNAQEYQGSTSLLSCVARKPHLDSFTIRADGQVEECMGMESGIIEESEEELFKEIEVMLREIATLYLQKATLYLFTDPQKSVNYAEEALSRWPDIPNGRTILKLANEMAETQLTKGG